VVYSTVPNSEHTIYIYMYVCSTVPNSEHYIYICVCVRGIRKSTVLLFRIRSTLYIYDI
jgi:hypothetical protein